MEKQRADSDRRQWRVKLAPKGLEQWDTIDSLVQKIAAAFVSQLDEAEQNEFLRLLAKVQKGLDTSIPPRSHSSVNKTQE